MTDTQVRVEHLEARLRERQFRLTPQRLALIRVIAASEGHPSASQLYDRIKGEYPTMSQATVYKTLTLLKELGEVLEIDLRDDSRYDGNRPIPHPHLICLRCGAISDGEDDLAQEVISRLERASGYRIVRHQLNAYGHCPSCSQGER